MVNDAHINNTIAEYGTALTELLTRIGFAQADPLTGYTVTVRKGAETRIEIRDRVSFNADGFELWLSYGNNEVDRFAMISRSWRDAITTATFKLDEGLTLWEAIALLQPLMGQQVREPLIEALNLFHTAVIMGDPIKVTAHLREPVGDT